MYLIQGLLAEQQFFAADRVEDEHVAVVCWVGVYHNVEVSHGPRELILAHEAHCHQIISLEVFGILRKQMAEQIDRLRKLIFLVCGLAVLEKLVLPQPHTPPVHDLHFAYGADFQVQP